MAVLNQVNAAITSAMKAHDQARLGALRLLKAALVNREVEKGRTLEAAEELQVVVSLVKQRRESAEQFKAGGRQELADKELADVPVLEAYLPAQADEARLEAAIDKAIADLNATSAKDMGRVMKAVMAGLAGQAVDGRAVNEMVRRKLG
jgi:uncharacterized protein YqeY